MIKAIIFDCFGVLINGAFEEVYSRAGGNPQKDKEFITDLLHSANLGLITSGEMRSKVTKQIGISEKKWQTEISQTQQPSQELIAYAKSLKNNYKIAILSNANTGTLERKFTSEQLAIFDTVIVSADVNFIKPQPEIFLMTAEKLNVEPKECIFIDDSPGFCQAAGLVGMQSICYKNFVQFKSEIQLLLNQV